MERRTVGILDILTFRVSVGVFPSDSSAGEIIKDKINGLRQSASNLEPGFREERMDLWERDASLRRIAQKFRINLD